MKVQPRHGFDEPHKHAHTETQRHRDTDTERQRYRDIERERERARESERERERHTTHTHTHTHPPPHTHTHTHTHTRAQLAMKSGPSRHSTTHPSRAGSHGSLSESCSGRALATLLLARHAAAQSKCACAERSVAGRSMTLRHQPNAR